MGPLELHLRRWIERATTIDGDDRRAIQAVFRQVLARVGAAHGLTTAPDREPLDELDGERELDWTTVDLDQLAGLYERALELPSERARKQSGTYYTPAALVDCLLDHCLEPALDHACARPDPAAALLDLKICDPACGSGRFLLAVARRLADRLVALDGRARTEAMAAVIERCIHGVDVDPIAIELCRLSLQIEAGGRARCDRLRCGDALLGAPAEHAPSWSAADAWCAARVWPAHAPTPETECTAADVRALAESYRFFHWSLAFPEATDGFDVVVGNPPWEMLEQPGDHTLPRLAGASRLIAGSGRFPIGAATRKSLYVLFAELGHALCGPHGRLGMVLPTEIVQGAIAERLTRPWFEARRVAAVFDFQNRRPRDQRPPKWFPDVHPQFRFSLICLAPEIDAPALCCDAGSIADTHDPARTYRHDTAAILRLCHGSFRLPMFRGPAERRTHERAYARGRPLAELLAEPGVAARLLFNFGPVEKQAKRRDGAPDHLRVYEGEHIHQFNHRHATRRGANTVRVEPHTLCDPEFAITTADWLPTELVHARLRQLVGAGPIPEYLLVLRRQARAADAHIGIAAIIPSAAVEGSLTCFVGPSADWAALLCASFNSFAFNHLLMARQSGPNVNRGVLAELPIVDRRIDEHPRFDRAWFTARVLELSYTASELEPFARACDHLGPPFAWSEPRRHERRCELEAALFHLYGFGLDDAANALDGFAIVARRERSEHGEFRSKRRILELLAEIRATDPDPR